ncbi:uncharacterized protein SCDLUD_000065 [Saccharomycodes ludwigii]|uniref:uncharacterized protein n=1 Tax=Saccharomycodes ludwigii TaxID=36035 RepID=UPI001E88C8AA|nr:hypothetical protein SCDLUD_000065 [Saccharomycodes ludwigii]KAH3902488.1 hypothetical protein SCDLUD_000065 [Saccharomycodes ludwigii]
MDESEFYNDLSAYEDYYDRSNDYGHTENDTTLNVENDLINEELYERNVINKDDKIVLKPIDNERRGYKRNFEEEGYMGNGLAVNNSKRKHTSKKGII